MGKKFLNKSKGTIGFGDGIEVESGNVIELDDELLKNKKAAIENLIKTGELVKGTKAKETPEPEDEPEGNTEEESEDSEPEEDESEEDEPEDEKK